MAKEIESTKGTPITEVLDGLSETYERDLNEAEGKKGTSDETDAASWDEIACTSLTKHGLSSTLAGVVNKDVCVTNNQKIFLDALIRKAAAEAKTQPEIDKAAADIVLLINSFRLSCDKCLNETCSLRDPDVCFGEDQRLLIASSLTSSPEEEPEVLDEAGLRKSIRAQMIAIEKQFPEWKTRGPSYDFERVLGDLVALAKKDGHKKPKVRVVRMNPPFALE